MKKVTLLATLLLLAPAAGQAQVTPDSTADRPAMRGRMGQMSPEMRRGWEEGYRQGRRDAMRPGAGRMAQRAMPAARGMRGMGVQAWRSELQLTDDQVKKLDEIRERQREMHQQRMAALRDDREKWLAQRELFQQQTRALMLEVLTPAQRTKLEELEKQAPAGRRGRM